MAGVVFLLEFGLYKGLMLKADDAQRRSEL
jgi:hypothetical protein